MALEQSSCIFQNFVNWSKLWSSFWANCVQMVHISVFSEVPEMKLEDHMNNNSTLALVLDYYSSDLTSGLSLLRSFYCLFHWMLESNSWIDICCSWSWSSYFASCLFFDACNSRCQCYLSFHCTNSRRCSRILGSYSSCLLNCSVSNLTCGFII